MKKHRRSALESFDGCPHRFDVLYNLCTNCGHRHQATPDDCPGEDGQACSCQQFAHVEDRGDESQRGIAFHEASFRYIDRLAAAKVPSDADEASAAFKEGIALSQVPSRLVTQVARLWRPFVEWFQLDLEAYFTAEKQEVDVFCLNCHWRGPMDAVDHKGTGTPTDPRVECCPECAGPVVGFSWIPDLVYVRPNEIEIIDWKTYYKGLTEEQARSEFQLKFYLWQAIHLWPNFASYKFTFNFVRLRYAVSITMTAEEIEAFTDEVKAIVLSIYEAQRTRNFPAIPGSHCSLCRLKCPIADNRFRMPVRITGPEERNAIAGQILVKEQEMKQLKKLLKEHCQTEGGFVHNGQIFAFWPEMETRYPADQVLKFLHDREVDTGDVTLSKSAMGKLADPKRASPAFLELLDELKIEKSGWTFRHKKTGEHIPPGVRDLLEEGGDDGDD